MIHITTVPIDQPGAFLPRPRTEGEFVEQRSGQLTVIEALHDLPADTVIELVATITVAPTFTLSSTSVLTIPATDQPP